MRKCVTAPAPFFKNFVSLWVAVAIIVAILTILYQNRNSKEEKKKKSDKDFLKLVRHRQLPTEIKVLISISNRPHVILR